VKLGPSDCDNHGANTESSGEIAPEQMRDAVRRGQRVAATSSMAKASMTSPGLTS
jgi:hypothetical protein